MFDGWAGAREEGSAPARCLLTLLPLAVLAALGCLAGCDTGSSPPPTRLMDGSPALTPPVALEGVEAPALLTKVRRLPGEPGAIGGLAAACLAAAGDFHPAPQAVERVGVGSRSVTFLEASGRGVLGCDDTPGEREGGRPWCGGAFGRLVDGRLADPRLDVLCTSRAGDPVGFAWVEPRPGTTYVAVHEDGFAEVYETAGGLPVRVASEHGVDRERARAEFTLSEHDRTGELLREYVLEAVVAG